MLGHDHALSGALAFAAVAPLLPVTGTQLAVAAALTAGAGILPDLDEPGSTIARTFGFLTGSFAWIVHQLSGGHRKGTHSLLGVALMTLLALWAGSWQRSAAATASWVPLTGRRGATAAKARAPDSAWSWPSMGGLPPEVQRPS